MLEATSTIIPTKSTMTYNIKNIQNDNLFSFSTECQFILFTQQTTELSDEDARYNSKLTSTIVLVYTAAKLS